MTTSYFSGAVLFLTVWIVYAWVKNEVNWMRLRRFGRKNGCEEPKVLKNRLPGGIERYWGMLKFKKGMDILEDHVHARYLKMGVGTYRIFNPFHSLVATSDPENMQAILATNFTNFELGPSRSQNMFELLGHGIFTADGEAWAHYRQQLKPQFSRDQISDLEAANHHLQILYRALPQKSSEEVDLLPLLLRFTMDVSTEFLFGKSVNSQTTALQSIDSGNDTELQAEEKFVQAMSYSQDYIIFRVRLFKFWWLARSQKFLDACQICKDYSADFVQRALSSTSPKPSPFASTPPSPKPSSPKANPEEKEKYILLNALTTQTRNPTELRDQMLHLLLAGRDTTAALLAWTLLLLSRNPTRYTKYRSIILSHFGPLSSSSPLSFTTLKACKPLTHILYETLRLYPLVPMNSRVAIRDTVLPVGGGSDGKKPIVVRRGERVTYKQYALNEASFVIARFLQKFERIEAVDMSGEDGMLGKKLSLTMSPHEVKVRLFAAGE
ncbi:putative cytochrome p450 family protein [Botrytis fragariae]|uniref:Putative cytochrome p450 family protein n=1 Tax=Botrytis fragariae TaxID=1964551 RepID=A0A8H6AYA5_9HELO|nr:putative cytochrome p450 family protein [Botrytis fragariae]KAF5876023.1 putative cytochrome p450 family protein [Botrytis fragariae]